MTQLEFKSLYSSIEDLLFGFAMRLTKNREDAKDLIQETTCLALEKRDRFRMGTNFKSWMTTIMYNTFVNGYRRKRTRNKVMVSNSAGDALISMKTTPESTTSSISAKELRNVIMSLEDSFRTPFMMHYKGYKYDEIAEAMGIKVGTVKSRIFFARKKMQKKIENMYTVPSHMIDHEKSTAHIRRG